jgi:hypothetical protein
METITRSGRAVQGFALGEVGRGGHGGGGHYGGGGYRGGHGYGRGLPGGWGWWGTPYVPDVVAPALGTCTAWGDPVTMPSGMVMAAQAALGASGYQPTAAQGPDGVLYRFSVENSQIVVRPCVSQQAGALGEPSLGLAGVNVSVSPAFAALTTGAAAGLLAHVLHAPMWGSILVGAGAALFTHVGIDRAATA